MMADDAMLRGNVARVAGSHIYDLPTLRRELGKWMREPSCQAIQNDRAARQQIFGAAARRS